MVVIGPFLTTGSQLVEIGCYWSISYNWVTTGCKWLLLVHFLQLGHNWLQMVVIGPFLTTGSQLLHSWFVIDMRSSLTLEWLLSIPLTRTKRSKLSTHLAGFAVKLKTHFFPDVPPNHVDFCCANDSFISWHVQMCVLSGLRLVTCSFVVITEPVSHRN